MKEITNKPLHSSQVPATAGMLYNMEERITYKFESRFGKVDGRFKQIDARFNKVDAQFKTLDSKIDGIRSEVHRLALLVEEQNARNKYVMDGYSQIYDLLVKKLG